MDFNQYAKDLGLVIQPQQTTSTTSAAELTSAGSRESILAIEAYNRDDTINQLVSVDGGTVYHEVLPQSSIFLPVKGGDKVYIKSASGTPAYEVRLGVRP